VRPEPDAELPSVEISGEVPAYVVAGDVLLVNVTATYPRIEDRPARTVDFLEFVYVSEKRER
jgi:hypothetical protein